LQAIALIWSNDKITGWQSTQVKLSLFIFPLLFSIENHLTREKLRKLFLFFCISCSISFLYCLLYSIYHYYPKGWNIVFNRMNISEGIMHPGYYSNYFAFAIVFCALELLHYKHLKKGRKYIYLFFICLFSFAIIMLASKTALIFLFLFTLYLLWYWSGILKNSLLRISLFVMLLFGTLIVFYIVPPIHNRITETWNTLRIVDHTVLFSNSTGARIAAWQLEGKIIKPNWLLGYGTGEANSLLMQEFKRGNYASLIEYNMHTHNQLLHVWIDLGLLGVLFLLSFIGFSFTEALQKGMKEAYWMSLLIFVNILTDDMLEIQAGIVFFIFFLCLLLNKKEWKTNSYY
jgi:O-antigen ligase